jgi:hypothetical protein
MSRAVKSFFIPVIHRPPGAMRHVAAPELPSQGGRARAMGHVAAPELPSQKGRAQSHVTRGSTRAHIVKEARSGAEGYVTASELISPRRQGPGPRDTWWRRSPPLQKYVIQKYSLRDSEWMYVLLIVLI